ncbi:Putative MetA-pathway of phenol degradation [Arenibacter nanhaiticus]|uniref:Putative MetA-pathway of phenol degradation n=1 Tax=Arenibacter nanhaiticus TaxID=558155 RepID=A0A1M6DL13_9FLAO|nr:transporter [Arenibacter nanhaiticus]SHI74037.1 Putative MetA-pathway of phenol degradation [Arenibacter nanhaiticus]
MAYLAKIKYFKRIVLLGFIFSYTLSFSQYTDVINSNRPGESVSAYAVGRNVLQAEAGLSFEQQDHSRLLTESDIFGVDLSLRYGLLWERLEINYEGIFNNQDKLDLNSGITNENKDFYRNRLGLKYLLYAPFKNEERNKPDIYSWKANNKFKLKNLLPAISIYAGANFVFGDNPYYKNAPIASPRVMIATQSRITPRFVLISNIAYDKIGTDFEEWNYSVSLSHSFRDPNWSVFIENQGIKGELYSDILFRSGVAHLITNNLQADINFGASFKSTPSRIFGALGMSYRLDMHQYKETPISDAEGGPIKKNSMKKKGKKQQQNYKKNTKKNKGEINF